MSSALPLSQHQGSNFIIFHKICLTTAAMLVARHGQMFMLFKWGSKACWVNIIKESWSFLFFFFLLSPLSCPLFVYLALLLRAALSLFLNFTSLDKFQLTSEPHVSLSGSTRPAWRAGYAEKCNAVDTGSTDALVSLNMWVWAKESTGMCCKSISWKRVCVIIHSSILPVRLMNPNTVDPVALSSRVFIKIIIYLKQPNHTAITVHACRMLNKSRGRVTERETKGKLNHSCHSANRPASLSV